LSWTARFQTKRKRKTDKKDPLRVAITLS